MQNENGVKLELFLDNGHVREDKSKILDASGKAIDGQIELDVSMEGGLMVATVKFYVADVVVTK